MAINWYCFVSNYNNSQTEWKDRLEEDREQLYHISIPGLKMRIHESCLRLDLLGAVMKGLQCQVCYLFEQDATIATYKELRTTN